MRLAIYLGGALLLLAAAFLVFRVVVRRNYRRHARLKPLASFLELLIFCLWATFVYVHRTADWPATHVGQLVSVVGSILFYGGFAITFLVMGVFGMRRAFGVVVNELKQTGAYGLSRNPQVVAFFVAMLGYLLLWPSWPNLGAVVLLAAMVQLMVATEEEHLRAVFGEEYAWYCARVPRYFGLRFFKRAP